MIRTLYRHRHSPIVTELPTEQLQSAVRDPQARLWIDMQAPSAEEYALVLEQLYRFHPLAIEDVVSDVHVPKVDDYGSYLYLVVHTLGLGQERMAIETHEVDIFLGNSYLITIHDEPMPVIDKLWRTDYHQERGLARGPAILLYDLLDRQVDSYVPLLEEFEIQVEALGDAIFRQERDQDEVLLNDILTAKTSALRLRRILIPQRELMQRLARSDYEVIPADARIYFRDVYDHMVRLADLTDSMRDLVSSTIETHLALANNRMSEVMKVLTIISTIFIPLSFLAGVYGMNFEHMPELHWRWAYPAIWLVFLSVGAGMLLFFRRRQWL
ncbi:MAG: magnesium transport protein CorA [Litorilinea sp.]|nr:MAG: magnesium transport protein CorA [Litorilinea sp.]